MRRFTNAGPAENRRFTDNQKYFPEEKIVYLKDKLRTMDDDKFSLISTAFK